MQLPSLPSTSKVTRIGGVMEHGVKMENRKVPAQEGALIVLTPARMVQIVLALLGRLGNSPPLAPSRQMLTPIRLPVLRINRLTGARSLGRKRS